jgi:hypothetical protein
MELLIGFDKDILDRFDNSSTQDTDITQLVSTLNSSIKILEKPYLPLTVEGLGKEYDALYLKKLQIKVIELGPRHPILE